MLLFNCGALVLFRKKDLFNVLKAHSILNSQDGYCQAQAPIASILLMHMPAEDGEFISDYIKNYEFTKNEYICSFLVLGRHLRQISQGILLP